MGFGGFFKGLGKGLAKAFSPSALKGEATIASVLLPGFAPLIMTAANAVITAEGNAIAAGVQNGTGPQKFAYAAMTFGPVYDSWAKQNNLPIIAENKAAFLQKSYELLQTLPEALDSIHTGVSTPIEQQVPAQPVNITNTTSPSAA